MRNISIKFVENKSKLNQLEYKIIDSNSNRKRYWYALCNANNILGNFKEIINLLLISVATIATADNTKSGSTQTDFASILSGPNISNSIVEHSFFDISVVNNIVFKNLKTDNPYLFVVLGFDYIIDILVALINILGTRYNNTSLLQSLIGLNADYNIIKSASRSAISDISINSDGTFSITKGVIRTKNGYITIINGTTTSLINTNTNQLIYDEGVSNANSIMYLSNSVKYNKNNNTWTVTDGSIENVSRDSITISNGKIIDGSLPTGSETVSINCDYDIRTISTLSTI